MNSMILGKIRSAARRIGGWTQQRDDFGRTIDFYNGVPLLDIGKKGDGTLIIPQTETQGTANGIASSIYAVRFGQDEADQAVTGLTNGGIQVDDLGELETKPALPYPDRVLLRPRRVRQGRRAPARKLEHSVGGKTTRSDAHDLGVPMLAGDPGERQGPEDALGAGPKRGDYRERQDGSQHVEVVANPKAGELILDDDGNTVDVEPASIPRRPEPEGRGDRRGAGPQGRRRDRHRLTDPTIRSPSRSPTVVGGSGRGPTRLV
jgi:hypothetical protein